MSWDQTAWGKILTQQRRPSVATLLLCLLLTTSWFSVPRFIWLAALIRGCCAAELLFTAKYWHHDFFQATVHFALSCHNCCNFNQCQWMDSSLSNTPLYSPFWHIRRVLLAAALLFARNCCAFVLCASVQKIWKQCIFLCLTCVWCQLMFSKRNDL